MTLSLPSPGSLLSLGDLALDVLVRPDGLLLPGGDTTGHVELMGGGSAANVAVWAARCGAQASFCGAIGSDRFGDLALAELAAEGVRPLIVRKAQPTGVILALIDPQGQRSMVSSQGADWELTPGELPAEDLRAAAHLHLTAWSLFRDPPRAAALRAAGVAAAAGARISLDPGSFQMISQMGREAFLALIGELPLALLLPNEDEARAMSGLTDPRDALLWMCAHFPEAQVALKLGLDGALVGGPEFSPTHVPATPDRATDATGAGDAFGGAYLAATLAGEHPVRAARLAVQAGGWVVGRYGARPPVDADWEARLTAFRSA